MTSCTTDVGMKEYSSSAAFVLIMHDPEAVDNKMTDLNSCRGPKACRVFELPQEKKVDFVCDDSVAQLLGHSSTQSRRQLERSRDCCESEGRVEHAANVASIGLASEPGGTPRPARS